MTSLTENTQNGDNEDDTLGPKIRHPSGPVYPNVIFLREKHDKTKMSSVAKLYQDIIQYSISQEYNKLQEKQHGEGFKVTNIGYWLLGNNKDYVDYYTDSKSGTPEYIIVASITKRIKRYLDNLEKWGIVRKLEQVDADTRNGQKTWLYGYRPVGIVIAWIIKYHHYKSEDRKQKAKNIIFDLIQKMFKSYSAYTTDFLAEFYHKLIDYDNNNQPGFCDSVIRNIISLFEFEPGGYHKAIDYFNHSHTVFATIARDVQPKRQR